MKPPKITKTGPNCEYQLVILTKTATANGADRTFDNIYHATRTYYNSCYW